MVLIQSFLDALANSDLKLANMEYFLNASKYDEKNVSQNFKSAESNWTEMFYMMDYDFRLHIYVNDTRTSLYQTMFVRATFSNKTDNSTVIAPAFVIQDISNLNSLEDTLVEGYDNWLVINLMPYDIYCSFKYSGKYSNNTDKTIYDRHFHTTGLPEESYVIRDVSSIMDMSIKQTKCLMSRGNKASPILFYN